VSRHGMVRGHGGPILYPTMSRIARTLSARLPAKSPLPLTGGGGEQQGLQGYLCGGAQAALTCDSSTTVRCPSGLREVFKVPRTKATEDHRCHMVERLVAPRIAGAVLRPQSDVA
jgi:hypothetical protein